MAQSSISVLAYRFNSNNNKLVEVVTISVPPPFEVVPCAPGPDASMRVYSKILYGTNFQQIAYTPDSVASLITRGNL